MTPCSPYPRPLPASSRYLAAVVAMSSSACRRIWQRPASSSDLWRLNQIAGTSSSVCPSAHEMAEAAVRRRSKSPPFSSSRGWWLRPAARKGPILTLPEPARFNYSEGSRVRQFGAANQRPASLPDLGRVPQISSTGSSQSPSEQVMTKAAAWWRPTSPTFSSFRGQAAAPGFIDRMSCPSNLRQLLRFFGTSSRSLSESAGWWRRQAAWKGRIYALHEPARFILSGLGQARQFVTANQRRQQTRKQHMYLVLDDHVDGFSIHKLDIDNDLEAGCGSAGTPLGLSEPPVLRIGPPTIGRRAQFAALGSHIIATCPSADEIPMRQEAQDSVTLIFDTKTAMLTMSRILPAGLENCYDAAIAVRNRLYVFESYSDNNDGIDSLYYFGGLHCLSADPNDDERDWTWRPLFNSSQFSWSWPRSPPDFPFDPKSITSLVVHPRTGTIFVSTCSQGVRGTFSYGTRGGGEWKRRGNWVLPFKGPVHYDDLLDAWVGLHFHSVDTADADGYLCACHIMSGWQPPKWKVGREQLFLKHPHWRHVDAKLVYMGERSKYCLMERLLPEGADKMNYVLRVTTFIVKYGEDGELRTMAHRPARFYKAPSYRCRFDVQAFWM